MASRRGGHHRHELVGINRLGNMPAIPGLECPRAIAARDIRRDRDRGNHGLLRPQGTHRLDQRISVLLRHADIGEQEVSRLTSEQLQRLAGRRRGADGGALHFQQRTQHVARIWLVVDDEHSQAGQCSAAWLAALAYRLSRANLANRKMHGECRAETLAATLCRYRAAMSFGEMPHDGETEPESTMTP